MNRFMLTITVATAMILGMQVTYAQTILYTPPGAAAAVAPVPLGQFIATRITDTHATGFRNWLAASAVNGNFDAAKGYTVFAVADGDFDPAKHPAEHYIVNGHVGVATMQGNADDAIALNGDKILLSRTGSSYYADGKRINGIIKNPEGTVYLLGGPATAFTL